MTLSLNCIVNDHRSTREYEMTTSIGPTTIAVLAVFALGSCFRDPSGESVVGRYVRAGDTIWLDSAGRYTRRFAGTDGVSGNDSGRWGIANHGKYLVLRDFRTFLPQHGTFEQGRGWHAPDTSRRPLVTFVLTRSRMGGTALELNPESGWGYVKR